MPGRSGLETTTPGSTTIVFVLSAQLAKQPANQTRADFYDKRPKQANEESRRPNFPLDHVFCRRNFPKIAAAMDGADGIGGVAHRSPLLPVAAGHTPCDMCLSGTDEPGALSRKALSLSVPENSCSGQAHRKLNYDPGVFGSCPAVTVQHYGAETWTSHPAIECFLTNTLLQLSHTPMEVWGPSVSGWP